MRDIKFRAWDKHGDDEYSAKMKDWETLLAIRYGSVGEVAHMYSLSIGAVKDRVHNYRKSLSKQGKLPDHLRSGTKPNPFKGGKL